MEAINTFEQLSHRLSRSSLALVSPKNSKDPKRPNHTAHKRGTKKSGSSSALVAHSKHARSKSAPELSLTPLGPATTDGCKFYSCIKLPSSLMGAESLGTFSGAGMRLLRQLLRSRLSHNIIQIIMLIRRQGFVLKQVGNCPLIPISHLVHLGPLRLDGHPPKHILLSHQLLLVGANPQIAQHKSCHHPTRKRLYRLEAQGRRIGSQLCLLLQIAPSWERFLSISGPGLRCLRMGTFLSQLIIPWSHISNLRSRSPGL